MGQFSLSADSPLVLTYPYIASLREMILKKSLLSAADGPVVSTTKEEEDNRVTMNHDETDVIGQFHNYLI